MPEITAFPVNSLVISIANIGDLPHHRVPKGIVMRIIYEPYDRCYYGELVKQPEDSTLEFRGRFNYNDSGVRKLERSDLISILQSEASKSLAEAQKKFNLISIYQRFPTVDAEIMNLCESISSAEMTEEQISEALSSSSLKIEPILFSIDDYNKLHQLISDME